MLPPILFSKKHRSDEEVAEWEAQQAKLGKDYDSPWLSGMVTFSGFVAAFVGSFAILLIVANLRHGTVWINEHLFPLTSEMPHGGFKESGYGKDMSIYSMEEYTRIKHVCVKLAG